MKRLTVGFPDPVAAKIEKMSEEIGIPQSTVVAMAVKEYFDQKDMIASLPKLLQLGENLSNMDSVTAKKMIEEIGLKK